jgi:phosphoglycolate phosphatase-like HAD superfamily hydrolase
VPRLRRPARAGFGSIGVNRRLVLFDIDGTLLLSGGAGRRAILGALQDETGVDAARAERIPFDGKTDPQIVAELLEAVGLPPPDPTTVSRMLDRYLTRLEADLALNAHRVTVMPGIAALLDRLETDQRVVLGLLTGNIAGGAELKLRASGLRFERFLVGAFGSDHADRSELPPFAVRRAVPFFGRVPHGDEVVIIGDTPADVTCGRCVSARAIGVGTGSYSTDQLRAAGAAAVFTDLSDLDLAYASIFGDRP